MTPRWDDELATETAPFETISFPAPAPREATPEPQLAPESHTRPRGARLNNAWLFTIVALAISLIGLLYLVQTSQVASLGYEVSRLERERADKALENQRLTWELSRYQSLPEVERQATGRLGMEPLEQVADRMYLTIPAPAAAELPTPEPEAGDDLSLPERIWARLTGTAHAANPGDAEASE